MSFNYICDLWSQAASFAGNPLVKVPHDVVINSAAKFMSPPYKMVDDPIQQTTDLITGAALGKKIFSGYVKDCCIYTAPRDFVVNKMAARVTDKLHDPIEKGMRAGLKSIFTDTIDQYCPTAVKTKVEIGMLGVHCLRHISNGVSNTMTKASEMTEGIQNTVGYYANGLAETRPVQWAGWGVQTIASGVYGGVSGLASCASWFVPECVSSGVQSIAGYTSSGISNAAQTIYENAPDESHGLNASAYIGDLSANAALSMLTKQDAVTNRSMVDNLIEDKARAELTKTVDGIFRSIFGVASVYAIDGLVTYAQSMLLAQMNTCSSSVTPLETAIAGLIIAGNVYKFAKGSGSLVSMVLPKITYVGYRISDNLPEGIKSKIPGQKVFAAMKYERDILRRAESINNWYGQLIGNDAISKALDTAFAEVLPDFAKEKIGRPSELARNGLIDYSLRKGYA